MATKKPTKTRQRAHRALLTAAQARELDRQLVEARLPSVRRPTGNLPRVEEAEDTPEYLAAWAKAIRNAVPAKDVKGLVADYRKIASNPKLGREDRAAARRRARALEGRSGRPRTRG